jgi:hypothetical protein
MSNMTTTLMISSLLEKEEAEAEDPPIRYMAVRNSCLPQTRAEGTQLDTGEAGLCTNNMIPMVISSRITCRPPSRNICNHLNPGSVTSEE